MNIQFSQEAAQKACDLLNEQSTEIENKRILLKASIDRMTGVWSGDLADTFIVGMRKHDEAIAQVKAFVDYLDNHITACKRNYHLTEQTSARRLKSIADMFM